MARKLVPLIIDHGSSVRAIELSDNSLAFTYFKDFLYIFGNAELDNAFLVGRLKFGFNSFINALKL